jgi:hypothetical protein
MRTPAPGPSIADTWVHAQLVARLPNYVQEIESECP